MAIEIRKKTIDGIEFSVQQFGGLYALQLKAELIRKFGPGIAHLFGTLLAKTDKKNFSLMDMDVNGEEIGAAIAGLMNEIREDELNKLLGKLLRNTAATFTSDNGEVNAVFPADDPKKFEAMFDLVFTGRLMTLYPLIFFILEVNYPDFFTKAGGIFSRLEKTALLKKARGNGES